MSDQHDRARTTTAPPSWTIEEEDTAARLYIGGNWIPSQAAALPTARELGQALNPAIRTLSVHPRDLRQWGSVLPALLFALQTSLAQRDARLELEQLPDNLRALLQLTGTVPPGSVPGPARIGWLERIGLAALRKTASLRAAGLTVVNYLGALPRALVGRGRFRGRDLIDALAQSGSQALPIITLVSLLVGSILAFVGAIQLQRFGAEIYIADLVGIAVAREMAAMMTAIVMAGRTGAAFAAHLATMQVNEEVDALRTLGLPPFDYLAVPRALALTLMMPMLYLYAAAVSILGGLAVAGGLLDLAPAAYLERTLDAVALRHFALGLFKSICFGTLIGLVSCHIGLQAGRSAAAVGAAATQAVVVSIVGIIVVDSLFAIASNLLRL